MYVYNIHTSTVYCLEKGSNKLSEPKREKWCGLWVHYSSLYTMVRHHQVNNSGWSSWVAGEGLVTSIPQIQRETAPTDFDLIAKKFSIWGPINSPKLTSAPKWGGRVHYRSHSPNLNYYRVLLSPPPHPNKDREGVGVGAVLLFVTRSKQTPENISGPNTQPWSLIENICWSIFIVEITMVQAHYVKLPLSSLY